MYLDELCWLYLLLCVDGCQESVQHVCEYIRLPLAQCFPARNDYKTIACQQHMYGIFLNSQLI